MNIKLALDPASKAEPLTPQTSRANAAIAAQTLVFEVYCWQGFFIAA